MKLVRIGTLFLALVFSLSSGAGERFELYNGVRSLGMGNSSIGSVNDETSLMVNPAGLGKLRNFFRNYF